MLGKALGILVVSALGGLAVIPASASRSTSTVDQLYGADLAYARHGKLWLLSIERGPERMVPTPLPVATVAWSPDGQDVVFSGSKGFGVVALAHREARVVFARRVPGGPDGTSWSPNSRYLAYGGPLMAVWIWDRTSGATRRLVRRVGIEYWSWANDSSRVAMSYRTRPVDLKSPVNPIAAIIDIRTGRWLHLGRGAVGPWSPDDRLLGFDHLWACGATGCVLAEGIRTSSGGPVTRLDRAVHSGLTDEEWAPQPTGYAYDRWLVGVRGHLVRHIPGRYIQVEGWSPNGRWVAVRRFTRTYRAALSVINSRSGQTRRVYVSAPVGTCDECFHASYDVTWNASSSAFAMIPPLACCGPGAGNGNAPTPLYIYTPRAGVHGRLVLGTRLSDPSSSIVGWVRHDREVLFVSHSTLFGLVVGRHRPFPILYGLPGDTSLPAFDLRPGA